MKHIVLVDGYKVAVYIKNCRYCKNVSILMGKHSEMCIDCLNDKTSYPNAHVPQVLRKYTSKQIITMIKKKDIQEFKIQRKRIEYSTWEVLR